MDVLLWISVLYRVERYVQLMRTLALPATGTGARALLDCQQFILFSLLLNHTKADSDCVRLSIQTFCNLLTAAAVI